MELDGRQHFEPVKHFGGKATYKEQREHDLLKMRFALTNGKNVIRLLSRSVAEEKKDWRNWVLKVIHELCLVKSSVPVVILEDHPLYHGMYEECIKGDPSFPVVKFVSMERVSVQGSSA